MSTSKGRVVVVGGGIIGTACTHYLAERGWEVTIVERGEFGMGCSHANCGFICPSHTLPLTAPGAITQALKSIFQRNSPFKIRLRFDPALWLWLLRFAGRCTKHHMMEAARARQALLVTSMALYEELIEKESLNCEWEKEGILFVIKTSEGMKELDEKVEILKETFDLKAKRYDGRELEELEPALKPGLAGAWHYLSDAQLRPDRLLSSWRKALEERGVTVLEQCEVQGLRTVNGKALALETSKGEMPADAFVFATGALTPLLQKHLGCNIPIQPGKGYSITMPRPSTCPKIPLLFEEHSVAVTPMKTGYRLGSTMEFAGYDSTMNKKRLDLLRNGASVYLHEPYCEPVEEEWFGWRPMTFDGKPIIDRCPIMENVLIAAGHNMLGMSMAPSTGKLVAEMINGEKPHIDPSPYSVGRF